MKAFIDKDFLLDTDFARDLYWKGAAKLPIFDLPLSPFPKGNSRQ